MHYNTISHQEQGLKQSLKQSHSSKASTKATTNQATTNQARSCRANNRTRGLVLISLALTCILGGLLLTCSSDPEPGETSPSKSTLSGELSYSLENQASQAEGIILSPLQEVEGVASMIIGIVAGKSITLYPQWSKAGQSISYSLEQEGEGLSIDKEKGILTITEVDAGQHNKVYTIKATGTGNYKGTYTLNIKLEVGTLIGSFEYKTTGTELSILEQTKHTTEAPEWEGGSAPSGVAYTLSKPNEHVQVDASSGAISIGRGLHKEYTEGYTIAVQARATDAVGVASVIIVIDIESWCGVVGKDSGTVVPTKKTGETWYTIEGWRELEWLARKAGTAATGASLASSYTMTEDIELPYQSCNERGETVAGYDPIGDSTTGFSGSFDGGDNTIRGLRIESSGDDIGLFGVASGNINDVRIEGAEIIGGKNVGTLAGKYTGGAISNVHITEDEEGKGSVKSTAAADSDVYVGGLVGHMSSDTADPAVTESSSAVAVGASGSYVGGLIGRQEGDKDITKSYTTGNVTGKNYVGGIVGRNRGYVYGYTSGDITGEENVGGISGYAYGGYGYTTGTIRGTKRVGGLAGYSTEYHSKGYSTGDVSASGDDVGGLVGYIVSGSLSGFSTGTIRGNKNVGGLVGSLGEVPLHGYAIGDVMGADSVGGLVGGMFIKLNTGQGYFRGNVISTASDPSSATFFGITVGKSASSENTSFYYSAKDGEGGLYQLSNGKRTAYSPTTDETAEGYRASTDLGTEVSVASSDTEEEIKAKFIGFTPNKWSFTAGQWPAFIAAVNNDDKQELPDFGDIPNSAEAQKPYTAP